MRLFLFPHAGGQHTSFQDWPYGLPDDVELVSYALPDRGRRHGGTPYREWRQLVSDLVDLVARHDDGVPFAFFGHSFGALAAFAVCHRLTAAGRRTPDVLLVSARRAPHVPAAEAAHELPDGEFLDLVRLWGLIPEELLADEELLRLVLPPLRRDLALDEQYRREPDARIGVPCVVYGGAEDRTVSRADLERWAECVADGVGFGVELLPGGHFFTRTAQPELLGSIAGHLDRVRARARPSVCAAEGRWYPAPELGVWERFRRQAAAGPDAPALLDPVRQWSYHEVDDAATALAAELLARGAGKDAPVGLLLPHSAEYCVSLLSCFAIGAPACLLEKNWPASLLARFVDSAGVGIVVTTPELAGLLPPQLRTGERTIVLGEGWWEIVAAGHAAPTFPEVAPSDVALISMTSGTSGVPKAVVNSHLGCLYCFDARYELYPYEESSRDGLNVFFAWECLRPLLVGRSAAIIPDDHIFDPVRLVDTLRAQAVTRIVVPPSLLESVLDHPAVGPQVAQRLDHMEVIFLMGEVVPSRVVDKAAALLPAHVRLVNAYSTWESLDVSFADLLPRPADGPEPSAFAPVGRIIDGSAAILLDAHGRVVPYGGVGELYFAGPGVAAGYLDDPAKTAERFVPAPAALADSPFADYVFYRTGDRARFLADGGLEILGRTGDVIKVRGFKVSLRSVEAVLSGHPGVSRVIVRPVIDDRTKQPNGLVAYVVGEGGHPSDTALARLRQTAKRDLPQYATPRSFIGLDAVPISQNGSRKLDLSALPAPPDESDAGSREEAFTAMERRLAEAWRDVLGGRAVGAGDNFFDAGGDSLSAARLSGLLAQRFGISVSVVEIFQAGTLHDMAVQLSGGSPERDSAAAPRVRPTGRVKLAVVGMAGRFPGAPDIGTFWENLRQGTDSLTEFSVDQLRDRGVPEDVLSHPKWVPAAQLLADADKFDAQFWGIGRREAVLMDPQQRVFLEVAWSALEQAGYARRSNPHRRRTGVFASCGIDGYLIHHLQGGGLMEPLDPAAVFLTEIGNEKDYLATRVAYMLDLGGPAMTVTSACSSALVAISQAAQALMSGQCDMAIAGASSINFPNLGYRYEDGLVGSADGRVRPFDQDASGTLFGDSAGAVVLKRLDDALADGDHVWAVVSGFGVSNDGHMKAGYAAPSARAQSQCISDAITMAGIDSGQISYVECHATATHIGDAIELKGLSDAFAEHRSAAEPLAGSCAIGSVKGNIGHANCAAGITGFIKTVLCLYHRTLVPTANYRVLNPKLVDFVDADGSPFTIEQSCREWSVAAPEHQIPRRAGVSSFGIGGTNAHVILEEPPVRAPAPGDAVPNGAGAERRSLHLVTASARTDTAFSRNADALAGFLEGLPDEDVAAAVRSMHLTRESHALRGYAVIGRDRDREPGLGDLRRLSGQPPRSAVRRGTTAVAFCFPGQGSQTAGMARGLYRGSVDGGRFRRHFDAACRSLALHLGTDPAAAILGADATSVMRPLITQCGLFAVEYALALTFIDIGVKPVASAGHSVGEYAAAVVAGLLTLDEASGLIAARARGTEELGAGESGGMLAVVGSEDRLTEWLHDRDGIWLAAQNAPGRVVLSGTAAALSDAERELAPMGFSCRSVPVSHPFHSPLMEPVARRLDAAAADLPARAPSVPMATNVTGSWLDAGYRPQTHWSGQATSAVRWRDCVETLLKWEPDVILEVGPGRVLTGFAAKCLEVAEGDRPLLLAAMPRAKEPDARDETDLLAAIGELWCSGVDLDFAAFHDGEPGSARDAAVRSRIPTYSFDRTSYWTRPEASPYVDPEPRTEPAAPGAALGNAASRTLVRFVDKPDAHTKLYCFPYAGGSSEAFRSWAHAAARWLDIVAVELPGRGGRSAEALPADDRGDRAALDALAAAIREDAGSSTVAFCGLSFGASVMFDLFGDQLADWARGDRIAAVCVVGRAPFGSGSAPTQQPVETLLMAPDELRADGTWTRDVLPLLEADLAFDSRSESRIAGRREGDAAGVVRCPLQVHCGLEDASFPSAAAGEWSAVTGSPVVEIDLHPGQHDFMLHQRDSILTQLTAFLGRLDPRDPGDRHRLHELRWVPVAASVPPASGRIPWIDFADAGPDESARFLREALGDAASTAAVVCRPRPELPADRYCADLLELLKALVAAEARGTLTFLLPADDRSGLAAGLTRSLDREEPGLLTRRVHDADAQAADGDPAWVDSLIQKAQSHGSEPDLLIRHGIALGRRLMPAFLPELPAGTLGGATGSYLITGGTGGLGRVLADWLIHTQGVDPSQVIVSGRQGPSGGAMRFLELDFTRSVDTDAIATRTGPLAGIFHLAGSLDDGVLRNLDGSRLPAVLAPKLALAPLTDLGRRTGAPWIVAFSSISALFGAAGQANYAAANAWMDAYAMWSPPGSGPDVVAIDWGTWGETGMAARNEKAMRAARADAETPLTSGTALALLGKVVSALLSGSTAGRNYAICDVGPDHAARAGALFATGGLVPEPMRPLSDRPSAPRTEDGTAPEDGIRDFLDAYVHQWDESRRLSDLGLDSLDFARIRADFTRRFGKDVPMAQIAKPDQRLGDLYALLSES